MKILMMTNTYTPIVGGLEKSIMTFSEELRAAGHEIKIVAPVFENMPKNEKDVIRIPALEKVAGTKFSVSLPLPELVLNLIEEYKPDIVHSHHPFLMGDLALRLCGQKKIPLVFTYHTMFEYYTDHFGMNHQTVQQFVIDLAIGYSNMADQVIAPSESVAGMLRDRKVQTPIDVVPTGIDVEYFTSAASSYRRTHKIPQNAFVVGHVGRLAPEKNLIFLTEAVAEFLKQNKQAHFLVVGNGPSEREMRKFVRSRDLQSRVHFGGVLKGKPLVAAYHAMDVFVFASKSETQGIVVAEAMAAGLPVIGLDAPGVREVVVDRKNGRLLMEASTKKFAAALLWCVSRKTAEWNKIKKEAIETANGFSSKTCAQKALAVYKKTVRRHEKYGEEELNQWQALLGRFKTEIDMMTNVSWAAGAALIKSAISEPSAGDRITKFYQKKIEHSRKEWMRELFKLRKKSGGSSEEMKAKVDAISEAVTQKVRVCESDLAELNRKIFTACEAFEKHLSEAQESIKSEFEKKEGVFSEGAAPDVQKTESEKA